MSRIPGMSAFDHDSGADLLDEGDIVAAAQEERLTRTKHDFAFPHAAGAYCLTEALLSAMPGWIKGREMLNRLILHELGAIERFDCKRPKLLFPEHLHV